MSHPVGGAAPSHGAPKTGGVSSMIQQAEKEGITASVVAALIGLMGGELGQLNDTLMPKIKWAEYLAGGIEGLAQIFGQSGSSLGKLSDADLDKIINEFGNNFKDLGQYIKTLEKKVKGATGYQKKQLESDIKFAKAFKKKLDAYIFAKPGSKLYGNPLQKFYEDMNKLQALENKMNPIKKQISKLENEIKKLPPNSPKRKALEKQLAADKAKYAPMEKQQKHYIAEMRKLLPKIAALAKPGADGKDSGPFYPLVQQAGRKLQLWQAMTGLWYNQAELTFKFFRSFAQLATGWISKAQNVIQFVTQHTQSTG